MLHADLAAAVERGVREGRTFRIGMARYRYQKSEIRRRAAENIPVLRPVASRLDPAGRFLDTDLAAALQEVGLEVPESFDEEVPDMSAGQRQLLAIARSILHNGQVLVSDESTSSVDTETDLMVTRALERYLRAASVTSIKIAHRLQTVISSDYILVLERGKVMEFGSPKHLLQMTGSFRQLVLQTGKDSSRKLVRLATRHHEVSKSIPTLDVEWDEGIQGDFEAYSVNI